MLSGDPQIANLCDGRTRFSWQLVFFIDAGAIESDVDLAHFESSDLKVDRRVHLQMSENSKLSAAGSQLESSPRRLRARRSDRSLASSRSTMVTAGISDSLRRLAKHQAPAG